MLLLKERSASQPTAASTLADTSAPPPIYSFLSWKSYPSLSIVVFFVECAVAIIVAFFVVVSAAIAVVAIIAVLVTMALNNL